MKHKDKNQLRYEPLINLDFKQPHLAYQASDRKSYEHYSATTSSLPIINSYLHSDMSKTRDPPRYSIEWKTPSPEYPDFRMIGGYDPIQFEKYALSISRL